MPMTWIEPEVFLEHRGVTVYHVYKDDCVSQGARLHWYTVDPEGSDEDNDLRTFDVRELSADDQPEPEDADAIRAAICRAIDDGALTADGLRDDEPTVPSRPPYYLLSRDEAERVLEWEALATLARPLDDETSFLVDRLVAFMGGGES